MEEMGLVGSEEQENVSLESRNRNGVILMPGKWLMWSFVIEEPR